MNVSNVITAGIFELIVYAAFNFSWIKDANAEFGLRIE
jgi:hypothetical protein